MTVLVVVAHPDDEVLGAGGTIARHAGEGESVHVVMVADGETSRPGHGDDARQKRGAASAAAAKVLGTRPPILFGLPDQRLDTIPLLDITQRIEAVIEQVKPVTIYTHHPHDLNLDHCIVCRAVMTACRPVPGHPVRAIYAFETPSSTEWAAPVAATSFQPRYFVDISDTLAKKQSALSCYEAEMHPFPHPRSGDAIEALAKWRGASCGVKVAEAFDVLRNIIHA